MLCTWFTPAKLRLPCYAQPKLNGFRAIYIDGQIHSRNGYRWRGPVLQHITAPLNSALGPGTILDGELYRHGWDLERIADALAFYRHTPAADTLQIAFYVFDIFMEAPFTERLTTCRQILPKIQTNHVQPVPTLSAEDLDAAHAIHRWNVHAGFEGTIYRHADAPYQCGRSRHLLKRKDKPGIRLQERARI